MYYRSGASKAAINHLARTLAKEEPSITTLAIRPGMVDTQMQTDIRGKYLQNMDEDDQAKFTGAHEEGEAVATGEARECDGEIGGGFGVRREGVEWSVFELE